MTFPDGKVREVNIDKQSVLLGILRWSDLLLVFYCGFGLIAAVSDLFLAYFIGVRPRIPDYFMVRSFIVIPVFAISLYTGWKHVGVINVRLWDAQILVFAMLALLFPIAHLLDFPPGLQRLSDEEFTKDFFGMVSGIVALSSLLFLVTVLMLMNTRIPSLDISLAQLLLRLNRKKDSTRVSTSRIERINTRDAIALGTLGFIFILIPIVSPVPTRSNVGIWLRVMGLLGGVGFFLMHKCRGNLQVRAESLLSVDRRKPILFLRSFGDEKGTTAESAETFLDFSLETRLSNHFRCFGPFIAVGSSAETITTPGAARIVLSDTEWKDRVISWIKDSAVIVMYCGKTHWVNWELAQVIGSARVENLILLIPEVEREDIAARISQLTLVFENTQWHSSLKRIGNVDDVRALKFAGDGSVISITSQWRKWCNRDADHLAALIAHYLILGKLKFASTTFN